MVTDRGKFGNLVTRVHKEHHDSCKTEVGEYGYIGDTWYFKSSFSGCKMNNNERIPTTTGVLRLIYTLEDNLDSIESSLSPTVLQYQEYVIVFFLFGVLY